MNRRIKKKKQKLAAMHASKWKYAKLGIKHAHAVSIETRHFLWGMTPNKDNYPRYLRNRRRCGKLDSKITKYILATRSCVMMYQSERKEVNMGRKQIPV